MRELLSIFKSYYHVSHLVVNQFVLGALASLRARTLAKSCDFSEPFHAKLHFAFLPGLGVNGKMLESKQVKVMTYCSAWSRWEHKVHANRGAV